MQKRIQIWLISSVIVLVVLGAPVISRPIADADYSDYMQEVQLRIKRNWQPPHLKNTGRAVVIFKVKKNGEITDAKIQQSSSSAEMDRSALDAVNTIGPLPALPSSADAEGVSIQFTFDYNVFDKNGRRHSRAYRRGAETRQAIGEFIKQLASNDSSNVVAQAFGIGLIVLLALILIIYKLISLGRPPRAEMRK